MRAGGTLPRLASRLAPALALALATIPPAAFPAPIAARPSAAATTALSAALPARPAASTTAGSAIATGLPEPVLDDLEEPVRRQLEAARAELEALVAEAGRRPGDPERRREVAAAYGELGALYLLYDQPPAARAGLEHAAGLAPAEPRWLHYLGVLLAREGEPAAAAETFRRALELDPADAARWVHRGRAELAFGEPEAAAESFRRALGLDAGLAAAHHGLGRALLATGAPEEAARAFEAALARAPGARSVHHGLAMAYRALGDLERARLELERFEPGEVPLPDPLLDSLEARLESAHAVYTRARMALDEGHHEEAVAEMLEAALTVDPGHFLSNLEMARLLLDRGAHGEALKHLGRAAEAEPGHRDVVFLTGRALVEQGHLEAALERFDALVERDPDDAEARIARAVAWTRTGREEAGLEELAAVVDSGKAPAEAEAAARVRLGQLLAARAAELARRGEVAAAAIRYERAAGYVPESPELRFGAATARLLAGDEAGARRILEEALAVLPESVPLEHALARVLAAAEDPAVRDGERAVELAREVFRRRPTFEHGETLAMALAEAGRFEAALEWQRRALARAEAVAPEAVPAIRRRLERLGRGEPIRAPWREAAASRDP